MHADILITSYQKDLPWLSFCLRFLLKNWRDPETKFIVRLNRDCHETVSQWTPYDRIIYRYVDPWPDTYHFQMYLKMTADLDSDADLLILVDSDVMLFFPAGLDDLLEDGKPIVYYLDWIAAESVAEAKWRSSTSSIMGIDLDRDYMVATPFSFWRDTFGLARERIEMVTGKQFRDAVYSDVPYDFHHFLGHRMIYADYEALGLYAAKFQPDRYVVKPRAAKRWPFQLFWSHSWSPAVEQMLQERLDSEFLV